MRLLLDNCVPVDLVPHIRGHEVATAIDMGWADRDDSDLLEALAGKFDVLLTVDVGIRFQQMIAGRPIAVIILRAKSNRVAHLARLIPELQRALKDIAPGDVREIG